MNTPGRATRPGVRGYFGVTMATTSLVLEMNFTPLTRPSLYRSQPLFTSTGVGPAAPGVAGF